MDKKLPLKQKPAFKKLRELLAKPQKTLLTYHQMGQRVEKLFPIKDGRKYGENKMVVLANALGKHDNYANDLWILRDFWNVYERAEVKELCQPNETGYQLSWTHVKHLLSLDGADRIGFQADCVNAEWSTKELHRAIKEHRGRMSAGGKPFVRPATLDAGLWQMIYEGNDWIRRHRQVWFGDDPAVGEDAKQENPQQVPELLDETIKVLNEIAWLIDRDLPRLKQMRAWSKKELARKAKPKAAKKKTTKRKVPLKKGAK